MPALSPYLEIANYHRGYISAKLMLKHEMLVNKSIPNDLWLKAKIALRKRIPSCRNDGWIMGRAVKNCTDQRV